MTAQISENARAPGVALDDDTREEARRALLAILGKSPVHQIAMRDAARCAGVGLATLYKYFGGKEAMVLAVLAPETSALIEALARASRREVGVKARVRAVLEASAEFVRSHNDAARAIFLNLPAGVWDDEPEGWVQRRRAILAEIFRNGVRDKSVRTDIAPEALALMVMGSCDAALEAGLRSGETIDPAGVSARLFAVLWPAVSAD